MTEAGRAKISAYWRGRKRGPQSPEHIRKLSAIRKGKTTPMKGRKHSEESKRRISEGTKKAMTPEICQYISDTQKQRMTPERRAHLSEIQKGDKNWNWNPDREQVKENKRFAAVVRSMLVRHTKRTVDVSSKRLGYSPKELKQHLESQFQPGMTWQNHGRRKDGWEIDHVRPISSFSKDTDLAIVNALSNLKPVWWRENAKKKDKFNV